MKADFFHVIFFNEFRANLDGSGAWAIGRMTGSSVSPQQARIMRCQWSGSVIFSIIIVGSTILFSLSSVISDKCNIRFLWQTYPRGLLSRATHGEMCCYFIPFTLLFIQQITLLNGLLINYIKQKSS